VSTPLLLKSIIRLSFPSFVYNLKQSLQTKPKTFEENIPSNIFGGPPYTYQIVNTLVNMRFIDTIFLATAASAISFPNLSGFINLLPRKDPECPAVWKDVSKELTAKFLTNGQCNPDARAAIRAVFHDCGGA